MARLAKLSPGLFDEEQKRLYETITAGPRADGRPPWAAGHGGAFELTTLVGYYATLALQLRVFRVGAPDR